MSFDAKLNKFRAQLYIQRSNESTSTSLSCEVTAQQSTHTHTPRIWTESLSEIEQASTISLTACSNKLMNEARGFDQERKPRCAMGLHQPSNPNCSPLESKPQTFTNHTPSILRLTILTFTFLLIGGTMSMYVLRVWDLRVLM